MTGYRVCPKPGCAELVSKGEPCPVHGRKANPRTDIAWSPNRDHAGHLRLRRQVIKYRGPVCERCGWTTTPDGKGLQMHHERPGDTPDAVLLLCRDCHKAVDSRAR